MGKLVTPRMCLDKLVSDVNSIVSYICSEFEAVGGDEIEFKSLKNASNSIRELLDGFNLIHGIVVKINGVTKYEILLHDQFVSKSQLYSNYAKALQVSFLTIGYKSFSIGEANRLFNSVYGSMEKSSKESNPLNTPLVCKSDTIITSEGKERKLELEMSVLLGEKLS